MNNIDKPGVSVIVCTYNQEDTLGICLDSILSQKVDFEFEILVADDCSQDGTRDVAKIYADRFPGKVRLIFNPVNMGLTRNYYHAIEEARGKYIADLAGDDQWCDENKLQRQLEMLDSDSEIMLVHGDWRYMYPDGSFSSPRGDNMPNKVTVTEGRKLLPILLNHRNDLYWVHLCTSMYRRDAVLALLDIYPDLMIGDPWRCEDYQLITLLAEKGKIAWQPGCVLNYRVGHVSISSEEDNGKNVRFASSVMRLTEKLTHILGFGNEVNEAYFKNNMRYVAMNMFNSGEAESRKIFIQLRGELPQRGNGLVVRVVTLLTANRFIWSLGRKIWLRIKKST